MSKIHKKRKKPRRKSSEVPKILAILADAVRISGTIAIFIIELFRGR